MDGGANSGGLVAWLIDAAAAAVLAVAVGVCGTCLGGSAAWGMTAAGMALVAALCLLRRIPPEPLRFAVALPPLARWENLLASNEAADFPSAMQLDCLELVDRFTDPPLEAPSTSKVVTLRPPAPTPGELQSRIERHLGGKPLMPDTSPAPSAPIVPLAADASAALRSALLELRRAVG